MSNFPPNQPIGYYAQPPVEKLRPTSVTVLAIIGIIFASFTILGGVCGIVQQFVTLGGPNPFIDAMKANTTLRMVNVVGFIVNLIIAVMLLIGSIGSLSLSRSARGLMVAVAIASLAQHVIGLVVYYAITAPIIEQVLQTSGGPALSGIRLWMNVSTAVSVVLGASLPVLILIFFNRPHVKAAFERGMPAAPQQPYYPS